MTEITKIIPQSNAPLHVAMVAPEIAPLAKTGGLGDVLGSLPKALRKLGVKVSLIMPAYRTVLQDGYRVEDTGLHFSVPVSSRREEGTVLKTMLDGDIPVFLIRADRYYDREYLYGTPAGDYPDNAERFVFFCRAALEILKADPPHILHAHDWQSALAITFLKAHPQLYPELASTRTVFTVHNLGYQGIFWALDWHLLNLDGEYFSPGYLEYYGNINFLKSGLVFADAITTVSPNYAGEIQTPEQGMGLEGVFRERSSRLTGILNGVDYSVWDPQVDPLISCKYGANDVSAKKTCKSELQRIFGLPIDAKVPLVGMVSRLAAQKGFDLLEMVAEPLFTRNLQFVLLGTGEEYYQQRFNQLPKRFPTKAGVNISFDEKLAHRVVAGADMLLMPSRYEPGGLTNLYSLRYGTIPVVRATGGLKDTTVEFDPAAGTGNGFVFQDYQTADLLEALDRALGVFKQKRRWSRLIKNAMTADFSWERSASKYLDLYQRLMLIG